ncbi:hypothetical protein DFH06DRAFT_1136923 [Mycena polygramma]|nr:hypothetical protein DFH06DRAFT_1136923 [Mycena polygramma]
MASMARLNPSLFPARDAGSTVLPSASGKTIQSRSEIVMLLAWLEAKKPRSQSPGLIKPSQAKSLAWVAAKLDGIGARYDLNLPKYSRWGRQMAAKCGVKGRQCGVKGPQWGVKGRQGGVTGGVTIQGEGRQLRCGGGWQWGVNSCVTVSHGGVKGRQFRVRKEKSSQNGDLSKVLAAPRHVGNSNLGGKLWVLVI